MSVKESRKHLGEENFENLSETHQSTAYSSPCSPGRKSEGIPRGNGHEFGSCKPIHNAQPGQHTEEGFSHRVDETPVMVSTGLADPQRGFHQQMESCQPDLLDVTGLNGTYEQFSRQALATLDYEKTTQSKDQKTRFQLEQWAYETCHRKMTLAERLEKSNWETQRFEKL
ncbi:hypothetical protein IFR05_011504 [Cadophora sp. M221]|nr:hypothetical protein IFR05_011504 [Cadophora sp. M221]